MNRRSSRPHARRAAWLPRLAMPLLLALAGLAAQAQPEPVEFRNGHWYADGAFASRTMYAVEGRLTSVVPTGASRVVDLAGGFVVPPFGEAHNHNLEDSRDAKDVINEYLYRGVFYVQMTGTIPDLSANIRHLLDKPQSVDASFTHGGFTGSQGWPRGLYRDVLRRMRYSHLAGPTGPLRPDWFDDRAYYVVTSPAEVERKFALLASHKPHLVKVYLECSDTGEHVRRLCRGRTGVDPSLLPAIVQVAHKAGLRVAAHVITAEDFRAAINAGVDEIAHLPGWFLVDAQLEPFARLGEEDAKLAAARKVKVMTTLFAGETMQMFRGRSLDEVAAALRGGHGHGHGHGHGAGAGPAHGQPSPHAAALEAERRVQAANLQLLKRFNVPLLVGADHAPTSLQEIQKLRATGLFSNAELLEMWSVTTPQGIFPGRRIGRLADGWEASFVVLEGDPLKDFEHVTRIRTRVKGGEVVKVSAPRPHTGHHH